MLQINSQYLSYVEQVSMINTSWFWILDNLSMNETLDAFHSAVLCNCFFFVHFLKQKI